MKKFMSVLLAFVMLFSSALTPLSVVYAQEESPLTVSEVSDEASAPDPAEGSAEGESASENSAGSSDPAAEDAATATADAGNSGEGGSAASADAGGAGSAGEGDPAAPTDAGAGLAGTENSAGDAAAAGEAAAPDANGMLLQGNMLSSANAVSAGATAAPAANETITDSYPTVIGLNASGSEPAVASGDVPVTPNINVVPAASGETQTYVAGVSTTGESTATVGGDVIVSPTINSNAEGNAEVVGIDAAGGGTAAVTGDVSVTSDTTVKSSVENYTQETNGINFNAGTNVSADDVIVDVKTEGASSTGAAGIDSDYSYGDGAQAVVEVKNDISVTVTANDGDANAAGIENHNANMDMKVGGDVTVEVSAAEGSASADGVSEGIWWGESTKADLHIAGDVSATAAGKDASSEGISVYDDSDVPVAVWADDVTSKATAEDGHAYATGVSNYATGNGGTNVNVASVEVVAEGNAEDEKYFYQTWVPDGGNVYGDETDTGKATTIVRGDVTVEAKSDTLYAEATGVSASSVGNVVYEKTDDEEPSEPGEGHYEDREGTRAVHAEGVSSYGINTDVTIEGNVNVTADSDRSYATGLSANSSNDGITIVDVIGNITAATSDSDQYKDDTNAIYAMIHGSGKVDVTVGDEEKLDDNGIITEGGNVTSDGNGIRVETQQDASGTAEVEVLGDVTAGVYGLELDMRGEDSVADIIVNGTLSGEESGIVISDDTTADNVQLTVWKVDLTEVEGEEEKHAVTKEGGRTVDPETKEVVREQTVTEETKKIEENIRYIIKIEPNENAKTLGVEGTTKIDGYETALEGDSVIFKVGAKEGYTVTGAYNGLGEKVPLVKNANGDYFVVVERGGGVYLSVTLEANTPEPDPEPDPDPTEEPTPEPGKDNNEEPGGDENGEIISQPRIYYAQGITENEEKKLTVKYDPAKTDRENYYDLISDAFFHGVNPITYEYDGDNKIVDIIKNRLIGSGFSNDEVYWLLKALGDLNINNKNDKKYLGIFLFSFYNYDFDANFNDNKTSNYKDIISKNGLIPLYVDNKVFIPEDRTLNHEESEKFSTEKNFQIVLFHEIGHAIQKSVWEKSFTRGQEYTHWLTDSPFHDFEKNILPALILDLSERISDALGSFTVNNDLSQRYEIIDQYMRNELNDDQKTKLIQMENNAFSQFADRYGENFENDDVLYNKFIETLQNVTLNYYDKRFGIKDPLSLTSDEINMIKDAYFDINVYGQNEVPESIQNNQKLTAYYRYLQTNGILKRTNDADLKYRLYESKNDGDNGNDIMVYDGLSGVTNGKFVYSAHPDEDYWYKDYDKKQNGKEPTYFQMTEAWAEFFSAKMVKNCSSGVCSTDINHQWFPTASDELEKLADAIYEYYTNPSNYRILRQGENISGHNRGGGGGHSF